MSSRRDESIGTSTETTPVRQSTWSTALIIPNYEKNCVLMIRSRSGRWNLPRITLPEDVYFTNFAKLHEQINSLLGPLLSTSVLYYAGYKYFDNDARTFGPAFTIVENHTQQDAVFLEGADFMTKNEVVTMPPRSLIPEEADVIDRFFEYSRDSTMSGCLKWQEIGWFEESAGWMRDIAKSIGIQLEGPVRQLTCSFMSTVLRATSWNGEKVVFAKFSHPNLPEPAMTKIVAELFPDIAPAPLKVDAERNSMIMESYGDTLQKIEAKERRERREAYALVLKATARMQVQSIQHIPKLQDTGFARRTVEMWMMDFERITKDCRLPQWLNAWGGYDPEDKRFIEFINLPRVVDVVKKKCKELSGYNIPLTLVHGDLTSGNIITRKGERAYCRFLDWGYSHIGHPLYDVCYLFDSVGASRGKDVAESLDLTEYFDFFSQYESRDRMREAFKLARDVYFCDLLAHDYNFLKEIGPHFSPALEDTIAAYVNCLWVKNVLQQ